MGTTWPDRLIFAGTFSAFFGGYLLFLKGPAANPTQQYFRIGVLAAGILLGIAGLVWKASLTSREE